MPDTYRLHRAVPRAGAKGRLGDEIPMHTKDLPVVFLPGLYGEIVTTYIKQLDGAVPRRSQQLVLVAFRPRNIIEGVLRVKTETEGQSL